MSSNVILVTGAGRGIGRKVAEQFLTKGMNVVATCTKPEDAPTLEEALNQRGEGRAVAVAVDVRDPEQVSRLASLIAERFGKLNVLINNAGIIDREPSRVETQKVEDWDRIIGTNLRGPFLVSQAMIPLLKKSGDGRIINVSGFLGTFASNMEGGGNPAYRISKAGINALSLIMAQELHADEIKVFAVDPGWVRTELGGPDAPRSAEEAAGDIVDVATKPVDLLESGVLLRSGVSVPW